MTDLHAVQRQFMEQLLSTDAANENHAGMQAYRDAYLLRIDEALRADFDGVHQILGDDDMLALTADYIDAHPSRHPSIRWIGQYLAGFIAQSNRWSRIPLLADIAHFEWAKSCLFDNVDADPATLDVLQTIDPEAWGQMRIEIIPALSINQYPDNVPQVWQKLRRRENISTPEVEQSGPWLMWRKEYLVHWRSLESLELSALEEALSGATFGELCQSLLDHVSEDQVPATAMQLLMQWCEDQIIFKFHP